uniref:SEA domain-containing protein n=1 Tax=Acrobeloides nanus TaxID=290746 RepID=A0A914CMH6_9BILA
MASSGWHNRDVYGKPKTNLPKSTENATTFTYSYNRTKIVLIILSAILLFSLVGLIIVIIILFATGVFTTRTTIATTTTPSPLNPGLVNKTFICSFNILDQANTAYSNTNSFEYLQSMLMINNAIGIMVTQSSLRDVTPSYDVISLANRGSDVNVQFRITISVPSSSTVNFQTILNLLQTGLPIFENQLNNTTVDPNSISVNMV